MRWIQRRPLNKHMTMRYASVLYILLHLYLSSYIGTILIVWHLSIRYSILHIIGGYIIMGQYLTQLFCVSIYSWKVQYNYDSLRISTSHDHHKPYLVNAIFIQLYQEDCIIWIRYNPISFHYYCYYYEVHSPSQIEIIY